MAQPDVPDPEGGHLDPALVRVGGWRKAAALTPGLVKEALSRRFRDFEAFRLIPATRGKSGPARDAGPPGYAAAA